MSNRLIVGGKYGGDYPISNPLTGSIAIGEALEASILKLLTSTEGRCFDGQLALSNIEYQLRGFFFRDSSRRYQLIAQMLSAEDSLICALQGLPSMQTIIGMYAGIRYKISDQRILTFKDMLHSDIAIGADKGNMELTINEMEGNDHLKTPARIQ